MTREPRMRVPHQVFVFQGCHHDDYPDVLLPHHPPEVGQSVPQGPLGADEVPLSGATLQSKKTTHTFIALWSQTVID